MPPTQPILFTRYQLQSGNRTMAPSCQRLGQGFENADVAVDSQPPMHCSSTMANIWKKKENL